MRESNPNPDVKTCSKCGLYFYQSELGVVLNRRTGREQVVCKTCKAAIQAPKRMAWQVAEFQQPWNWNEKSWRRVCQSRNKASGIVSAEIDKILAAMDVAVEFLSD